MSDYYKKAQDQSGQIKNGSLIIFNTGILDPDQQENNSLYDPNMISTLYNQQNQLNNMTDEAKQEQANTFDYSKIDYNKYIDSIYSKDKKKNYNQKTNVYYDKNAVNDNVNAYYESFYDEEKKDTQNIDTTQQITNNQANIDNNINNNINDIKQDDFKVPFGMGSLGSDKKERKRKSKFDDTTESVNLSTEMINQNSNFAVPK